MSVHPSKKSEVNFLRNHTQIKDEGHGRNK